MQILLGSQSLPYPCQSKVVNRPSLKSVFTIALIFGAAALLTGCFAAPLGASPTSSPTPDLTQTAVFKDALAEAVRLLPTSTLTPTVTPLPPTLTPTPTPIRTPPALPALFSSPVLAKDVLPQTYIKDTCEYLKARWDPNNSAPGTAVMVIMYHSVTEDYNTLLPDGSQVHHSDLVKTFEHAHELGFQTITTAQLADFLDYNAKIPQRSLLMIVDDRKRKEYYETHFVSYLKKYDWTITNAWISATDTPEYLWKENQDVVNAGWVDPQAHGVVHNIPIGDFTKDDYILGELQGSIDAIKSRFGRTPLGFIWPGGGFSRRAVELARQTGYRVGFTTNPRGPVMYNWIPQADQLNPNRPGWLPEIPAGDPRLTLPRYWSIDAAYRLDDVVNVGKQAAEAANTSKGDELEYYDIVCKARTGEIPTPVP